MQAYDAVVIGSGFGGAVTACRLAQAGFKVCIVERGKDYRKQAFPRNYSDLTAGWLYTPSKPGLYDLHATSEMITVQGAGYGGGSLVYANVQMRPPHDVFAEGWPSDYSRTTLDPYYDLVAHMLEVSPLPQSEVNRSPKTAVMHAVADTLGRKEQLFAPNLAVRFGGADGTPNRHGAAQNACTMCGECDVGCNVKAKNTLDLNYLHVAEQYGAIALTEARVTCIEQTASQYRVCYEGPHGEVQYLESKFVFLCAGAVHSTELLLRCRDEFRTLPALSPRLGERYSGNGDFLSFVFDPKIERGRADPARGPVITTSLLYDRGSDDKRRWFVLQEGGLPRQAIPLLKLLDPNFLDLERRIGSRSEGPLVLLAMGRDKANGKIELTPHTHCLRLVWDLKSNAPLYATQSRLSHDVAEAVGGKLGFAPGWQYLNKPISVHNLGGCCMGENVSEGVTSSRGAVFNYPGLFVMDGAILPESTGVNPSHTIAAVAERNIEAFIRTEKTNPHWRAKEWNHVKPIHEPLDQVVAALPLSGVKPPVWSAAGLSFSESMAGFLRRELHADGANPSGLRQASVARMDVTVTIVSLDDFVADYRHTAEIGGRLIAGEFTGSEGVAVSGGRFHLFAPGQGSSREMNYVIPFYGVDGQPYTFEGYKRVPDSGELRPWRSTTTLVSLVREGHGPEGKILATGLLRLTVPGLVRELFSFRTPGAHTMAESVTTLVKFGRLFVGNLLNSYAEKTGPEVRSETPSLANSKTPHVQVQPS